MKCLLHLLFFCFIWTGVAQGTDLPVTNPLDLNPNNDLGTESSDRGTVLNMPSMMDQDMFKRKESPKIQMLPTRELVQAGHDLKLDANIASAEKNSSNMFFGNMYLGDFTTTADFIGIVMRDHEYIDGGSCENYSQWKSSGVQSVIE